MKILQISIEVNSGSVGKIAEQIGLEVLKERWESFITFARDHQHSKSQVIKIGNMMDVYLHVARTRLFDDHCLASTSPTKALVQQIKTIQPDIIVLHHIHGYFLNMEILFDYLSKCNIPVVWIFHDCWSFTGHCTHFEEIGCEKWKTECNSCPLKTDYPASYFLDQSTRNFRIKKRLFNSIDNLTIVSVSQWMKALIKESFLSKHHIEVINNGIDLDIFKPRNNVQNLKKELGITDKFIILGIAGVWTRSKGLDDFYKLSKLIDKQTVIILVGLNDKQIEKLPSGIIGIKKTENVAALANLYSMSDLFLNLTYNDTFPTTNLEALACGTPVLTYKTGGSIEAVSEDTGFVVEKGDLDSVLKVINFVKINGKAPYSEACRERAVRLFNKEERFKEYINLFKKLKYE